VAPQQRRNGRTYTFDHYRLEGRATVRIHTGFGRDTDSDQYQDRCHYVWDNRSDTATLRNDRGRFIDDESSGSATQGAPSGDCLAHRPCEWNGHTSKASPDGRHRS
jgi:hypothetical protein